VELLVTLALMIFMVVMLHGFGSRSNQQRQMKSCQKNLQKIHLALQIFANEHNGLFPAQAGALTSFDLASGNVRWRLPSVETKGLFFDDAAMIYVNTTSATPDNLKYSRQIDVTDKIHPVVLKVEARTGKTLWRANNEGTVSYVFGKLVYTAESYHGDDDDSDGLLGMNTVFHIPAHVRIKRLDANNGRVLWHHYQPRFPLDVRYEKNSIHLLFKKEVQILKFILL